MSIILTSITLVMGQKSNIKSLQFKVSGNCEMCQKTIETAVFKKDGVSKGEWDKDSKVLSVTFDSSKTSADEILKQVAYAGYDNAQYLAPDEAYVKLPECCKYKRELKKVASSQNENHKTGHNHGDAPKAAVIKQGLENVVNDYFLVKDALVKSDATKVSESAAKLLKSLESVQMGNLNPKEHDAWMKVEKQLVTQAKAINANKDLAKQRELFKGLSNNMLPLAKSAKLSQKVYIQNCPMYNDGKGADWLSKEQGIKNPYYGASMLTCGSTVETIEP